MKNMKFDKYAPEEVRTLDLDYGAVYSNQLSYRGAFIKRIEKKGFEPISAIKHGRVIICSVYQVPALLYDWVGCQ
jgi:hypothetical protein